MVFNFAFAVVQVDFSHFQEDVQLRMAAAESGISSSTAHAPATPTASGRGAAFQAALSNVTGHSPGNSMPAEIMALPQEEKVKRLARDIHSLFQRFDAGALSVDHFREHLHALGVDETEESRRLLRQTPLNFSDFFRALTHTDPATQHAAGRVTNPAATTPSRAPLGLHAAGSGAPLSGRRLGPRSHEQQGDIVTWRGGTGEGASGIGNTRGKYDNRHITETGAGAIIFNKEETADCPIQDVSDWHAYDRSKGKEKKLPAESGVGKSLWGAAKGVGYAGEQDLPDSRFESVTQANARAGLGGAYASARPKTSAGYATADQGLLREQVYGVIRQLDQGTLTTKSFAAQLQRLGVDMPPAVSVLLQKYDSNGSATFKQFVGAFQDYFAERAASQPVFVPPPTPEEHRPGTAPEANRSGRAMGVYYSRDGLNRTTALHAGHGDILTWTSGVKATPDEDKRAAMLAGHRVGMQRRRHLYETSTGVNNIISWNGDTAGTPGLDGVRDRISRRGIPATARKNAGNIIQWAGGHFHDTDHAAKMAGVTDAAPQYDGGRGRGGDILATGVRSGRGRALPATAVAIKERFGTETPYGTVADEAPGTGQEVQSARTNTNPNFSGGEWLTDANAQRQVYANQPAQATPAYTSAPYNHQYEMQFQSADHDVQRQADGTYS